MAGHCTYWLSAPGGASSGPLTATLARLVDFLEVFAGFAEAPLGPLGAHLASPRGPQEQADSKHLNVGIDSQGLSKEQGLAPGPP